MLIWTIRPDDLIVCEGPKCAEYHNGHNEDEIKDGDIIIKRYDNGAEELAIMGEGRIRIIYNTGDIVHVDEQDRVITIITHDKRIWNYANTTG